MRKRDPSVIREKRAALQLPGQEAQLPEGLPVVMTGWAAEEGTALLAKRREAELSARFHPDLIRAAKAIRSAGALFPQVPACVWPLSEGGLLEGLWRLAGELDCGFRVDLKAVPVRQESIEICEYFGLDPYAMPSGGAALTVAVREWPLLEQLRASGRNAAVIGRLSADHDCLLLCDGRSRYLNRPVRDDALDRLMGN